MYFVDGYLTLIGIRLSWKTLMSFGRVLMLRCRHAMRVKRTVCESNVRYRLVLMLYNLRLDIWMWTRILWMVKTSSVRPKLQGVHNEPSQGSPGSQIKSNIMHSRKSYKMTSMH